MTDRALAATLREAARGALLEEGSTRPAALLRIGLALLAWTRFGRELLLFEAHGAARLAVHLSFFASTTLMLAGCWSRLATAWAAASLFALYFYVGATLGVDTYVHHHVYLLAASTALVALTPCGGSYSVDRWRAVGAAARAGRPPPPERGALWAVRLLALQVSLVYFWGAYDKTSAAYLSGERLEHYAMFFYTGSDYPRLPGFGALMAASAVGSVALEYLLAFGLWSARLRRWLIPAGLAFHGVIYCTLPVHTFSLNICLLYLAYLPAEGVHRAIDALSGAPTREDVP